MEAFRGTLASELCAISHRWFAPSQPDDENLTQQRAVSQFLEEREGIKWVWMDYWCMAQDGRTEAAKQAGEPDTRSPAEKAEFNWMLQNANLLFLGCHTLILLDLSYLSRFWTQFEAWLAMQSVSEEGLHPAVDISLRMTPKPILTARLEGGDAEANPFVIALKSIWAKRTPLEAELVLKQADVMVTNQKDKDVQLKKILRLDAEVKEVMRRGKTHKVERNA